MKARQAPFSKACLADVLSSSTAFYAQPQHSS